MSPCGILHTHRTLSERDGMSVGETMGRNVSTRLTYDRAVCRIVGPVTLLTNLSSTMGCVQLRYFTVHTLLLYVGLFHCVCIVNAL